MQLSGQQVLFGTEWTVTGRVRMRRRVVTEVRTIEVVVRREELVVETADLVAVSPDSRTWTGTAFGGPSVGPPAAGPPLVVVLHEEVPDIRVTTRPYERVTLLRRLLSREVPVSATAAHEEAVLETRGPPGP